MRVARWQLGQRQRAGHRAVDLAVEDEPDVAAGDLDAVCLGYHLVSPVDDSVTL